MQACLPRDRSCRAKRTLKALLSYGQGKAESRHLYESGGIERTCSSPGRLLHSGPSKRWPFGRSDLYSTGTAFPSQYWSFRATGGSREISPAMPEPINPGFASRRLLHTDRICQSPGRLLHSGPPFVGPAVEATRILRELPPLLATGHVERNAVGSRPLHESGGSNRICLCSERLLHAAAPPSRLWSKRPAFVGTCLPPPTQVISSDRTLKALPV